MTTENPFSRLTDRELQIVRLAVSGLAVVQMAAKLGIAEDVVRHQLYVDIFDKLGVSTRWELAQLVLKHPLP